VYDQKRHNFYMTFQWLVGSPLQHYTLTPKPPDPALTVLLLVPAW